MATDVENNVTEANQRAWNAQRFNAWVSAFGSPEVEAARIIADPERVLRRLSPYLGEVTGKRICNVQGSHGRIAVALALQGAVVTVVDFSEENRRYALDLAAAAGVTIDYTLCDIMEADDRIKARDFDVLVLELGILHYHQDIEGFFTVMCKLAGDGGTLLLNEFHPVQRKLFWTEGLRDYFQTDLVEADVPNPDVSGASLGRCLYRFWTMGDILTAIIRAGFTIVRLDEHPDRTDPTIPGSFTLLARA
ncbi:MAG TPA: methyltransferase domain-containing protein [Rhizobium sp.]